MLINDRHTKCLLSAFQNIPVNVLYFFFCYNYNFIELNSFSLLTNHSPVMYVTLAIYFKF